MAAAGTQFSAGAQLLIADVVLPVPGRDRYSYAVPAELGDLRRGECVAVPLGRRWATGFVVAVEYRPPPEFRLRPIAERVAGIRVPSELLALVEWAAVYYRCTLGEFLAGVVPAGVRGAVDTRAERRVARIPEATPTLTRRQAEVLAALPERESVTVAEAARLAACTPATVERLVAAGALSLTTEDEIVEERLSARAERHPPNAEQAAAIDGLWQAIADRDPTPHLLYGVTGSGKTLVYQELAERVIASGRRVLVLLPEIALTPQLAARFRARFERVVVWHSGFTAGERNRQWRAVAAGEVDLVIGARSALFAPLPDLGLIVVDEEHEPSYKQETVPRYHARDLAVVYARQLAVPVVLGSATPSLETYRNASEGRYRVHVLKQRPRGGRLPEPTVVDMSEEWRSGAGGRSPVSARLVDELQAAKAAGDQAIVLLNRRGWSPVVTCVACGDAIKCRACDVSLTYHKGVDRLRCHYCGHEEPMPRDCPHCGQPDLSTKGLGTEQLAAVLGERVPGLRVLRVDADTVAGRQGHARLLRAFADGEADCLVGTQMVAKGLDFPRVTLVGIVGADHGLHIPDFRAAERTYQLVAQVAGRAGRGERPGRVVVQSFDTEAAAITCALRHRAKTFYTHELSLRRDYAYPPHGGLVRILWRGPDAGRVQMVAEEQGQLLRAASDGEVILGPTPAGLALLKGQYRWHALVKAASRGAAQRYLDRLLASGRLREQKGVKVAVDVDPFAIT